MTDSIAERLLKTSKDKCAAFLKSEMLFVHIRVDNVHVH